MENFVNNSRFERVYLRHQHSFDDGDFFCGYSDREIGTTATIQINKMYEDISEWLMDNCNVCSHFT